MNKLLAIFPRLLDIARAVPHLLVIAWRHERGGLYILRDRPDWLVEELAWWAIDADTPPFTAEVIRDARQESYRRLTRVFRQTPGWDPAAMQVVEDLALGLLADQRARDRL